MNFTDQRSIVWCVALSVIGCGACVSTAQSVAETQPKDTVASPSHARPNVLLIVSDDQAWTDYGFMGHPHLQTPNLDRLARESLAFRRGYVPSSLCCPSLATILTGLYPHQHKITSNDPPLVPGLSGAAYHASNAFRSGRSRMNEHLQAVPTLPRLLSEKGYLTLQTGKFWQGHFSHGGFTHGMTRGDRHGDDGLKIGRETLQPIEDFWDLAQEKQQPWMVWYAPMMPHDPHNPPESFLARTRPIAPSETIPKYWAMVEWFDATIGELLDSLDRRGLREDTMVVYVTDNGWIQNPEKPGYAPKSKQSPYEGGVRTPILFRWPSRIEPQFVEELAHSIDIVPTVLRRVGIELPKDLPGLDLTDPDSRGQRQAVFGECFTHNANDLDDPRANLRWRWIVRGEWKLIVPNPVLETNAEPELFQLSTDPSEEENALARYPKVADQLQKELDAWWR